MKRDVLLTLFNSPARPVPSKVTFTDKLPSLIKRAQGLISCHGDGDSVMCPPPPPPCVSGPAGTALDKVALEQVLTSSPWHRAIWAEALVPPPTTTTTITPITPWWGSLIGARRG
ncbi:unnamed protein product [Arctogadus glacialis]